MSASLVGSEMCIRDRLAMQSRQAAARCSPYVPPSFAINSAVLPLTPVSYTHLTLPTICSV
eukprot:15147695-Alexandrium_andersonii.AAC.1